MTGTALRRKGREVLPIDRKLKSRGLRKRILVVLLVVGMSFCVLPNAWASTYASGEKTNDVEIYVGYFGNTYIELADVTEAEMENLECGQWAYSAIDSGYFTRYNLAYGVTMTSLLDYVHVNVGDIAMIHFLGTDNDYWAGFPNLFIERYFYPYLGPGYVQADPDASDVTLITSTYETVPTILAFTQSLARDTREFNYDNYVNGMSDEMCLRIVFGQATWNEVSTSDSVKWVYRIAVQLVGTPIKIENMEMDYGSEAPLTITVDTGYEELDEMIWNNLTINADGGVELIENDDGSYTVKAVNPGTSRIEVSYDDGSGEGSFLATGFVEVGNAPGGGGGDTGGDDPNDGGGGTGDTGDTGGEEIAPDEGDDGDNNPDSGTSNPDNNPTDNNQDDGNESDSTPTTTPTDGTGSGGGSGTGGNQTGSGGTSSSGNGGSSGGADTGSGSGGGVPSTQAGGTTGSDVGGGDPTLDASGDSSVASSGVNASGDLVPMSSEGQAIYDQVEGYMQGLLDQMEDQLSGEQVTNLTREVQEYIEELIKQMEEDAEELDTEQIVEMVKQYIDELVGAETAESLSTEEAATDGLSDQSEAAQSVYLSLGNVAGGDTAGGSVSGTSSKGGSGGKMLETDEWPLSYTLILIAVLAALFVAGGTYRSLRFRREIAER